MLPLVFELLHGDSDVAALVEDRIYRHGEAPEGVEAPYVTWFVVSAPPENALGEAPRIDRFELQIDCWSDNEGAGDEGVETLATAVRNVIETQHYVNSIVINGKDPETRRYRIGMSMTWWLDR